MGGRDRERKRGKREEMKREEEKGRERTGKRGGEVGESV